MFIHDKKDNVVGACNVCSVKYLGGVTHIPNFFFVFACKIKRSCFFLLHYVTNQGRLLFSVLSDAGKTQENDRNLDLADGPGWAQGEGGLKNGNLSMCEGLGFKVKKFFVKITLGSV